MLLAALVSVCVIGQADQETPRDYRTIAKLDRRPWKVGVSKDGKVVAVAVGEEVAKKREEVFFFNVASGEEIGRFPCQGFDLLPDGKRVACWEEEKGVVIYDIESKKEVRRLAREDQGGIDRAVESNEMEELAVSPDGKFLALTLRSWKNDRGVHVSVWDLAKGDFIHSIGAPQTQQAFTRSPWRMEWSPDSRFLAVVVFEGVLLIESGTWKIAKSLKVGKVVSSCVGLAWSRDNALVAVGWDPAGSDTNKVSIFDAKTGATKRSFSIEARYGDSLAFIKDGKTLGGGGAHGVHLWDIESGKTLGTLASRPPSGVTDMACSSDGEFLAVASGSKELQLWTFRPSTETKDGDKKDK